MRRWPESQAPPGCPADSRCGGSGAPPTGPPEDYAPNTDVCTRPDCILVSSRSPLKYVFRTSSMAWQNPQMKNREATMRNANRKGLRLDFMSISIAVVYYGFWLMENALAAFAQSVLLILLHLRQPGFAHRDALGFAVIIPDRRERHGLGLFHQREARGVIAGQFQFLEVVDRVEHGDAQRAKHVPSTDGPRRNPVDAGIEEIQPNMRATEIIATHQLLRDAQQGIIQNDDMVAVPANAAADMQQYLRHETQDGRNFVGHVFRRVIVAGVKADQLLVFDGVTQAKLMHTHCVALGADAEQLALDSVEIVVRIEPFFENLVKRAGESLARTPPVGRRILHAVGNPDIRNRGCGERLAHRRADFAAGLTMFNPELPYAFVRVRQSEALGGLRVREAGWVEIQADADGPGPVNPVLEMFRPDFVAVNFFAAKLAVESV